MELPDPRAVSILSLRQQSRATRFQANPPAATIPISEHDHRHQRLHGESDRRLKQQDRSKN
jgi:hypothetical protein